ncbi:F-box domain containing protein [Metarhizium album ARSEF 1941]|uniref:F-box domain containing protein n=1 Tax=Metarhizium album (strain ARSEF 1941) TaxID=1081103 RepID=A0A0B2WY66_METAS|nr:F-box domain containing protein [Metarhizium album ARSEF 1941]KHN98544.1 F-box domain containing protein [Metarhizium album ARSEF 1941]
MKSAQLNPKNATQYARDLGNDAMATSICKFDENEEPSTDRTHSGTRPTEDGLNNSKDAGRKRKLADALSAEELPSSKRAWLDPNDQKEPDSPPPVRPSMASRLPAEAWHHVFTFTPPRTLGNLMLVSREFNSYLDPLSRFQPPHAFGSSTAHSLSKLAPDAIWQASKRLFWPRMPAALKGRSELEMWRLCCSPACQFCGVRGNFAAGNKPGGQWERGPGLQGISPVFPFFIVSCGRCLSAKSTTEIDLLLNSSLPAALVPGLPVVFLTQENHVVPPHVLASISLSRAQPIKLFWSEQIEKMKYALENAKRSRPAAAEEWIKGLEQQGKCCLADVARWERWHHAGGVEEMRRPSPRICANAATHNQKPSIGCWPDSGCLTAMVNRSIEMKAVMKGGHKETLSDHHGSAPASVLANISGLPGAQVESVDETLTEGVTVPDFVSKPTSVEAEAARRAEIERRAPLLQPPIPPMALTHMPAFQEALGSATPLDNDAWQVLGRHLLKQRKEADMKEGEFQVNFQSAGGLVADVDPHGPLEGAKIMDVDCDHAQELLRGQISKLADEIIRNEWSWSGSTVTRKNAPKFAADVLLYVREEFYAKIAKDVRTAQGAGKNVVIKPAEQTWTQKLTLENMRWIFDAKIRPRTDPVRKDVFLCNGCDGVAKFYKFNGLLYHYASKHAKTLSLGKSVVHWGAEWPEKPIFKADPQQYALAHTKTKTKTLETYFPCIPRLPHPESAQPGPEQGHHSRDLGMSVSTNYRQDNRLQGSYEGGLSYEQDYPSRPHVPQHGRPEPRSEPWKKTVVSQTTGHGQSLGNRKSGKTWRALAQKSKRLDYIIKRATHTWRKLANEKRLHGSVKVCAVIHHAAKSFRNKYSEPAPLNLFIEALETHKALGQLSAVTGLSCKACKLDPASGLQSKTYTLVNLSRHFDWKHSDHAAPSMDKPFDWRADMIWLSEVSDPMTLRSVVGDDKDLLDVVSDALPSAFEALGCGREQEAERSGRGHETARRAPDPDRHQSSTMASTVRRAAPRLEVDGLEIIEQPAAWPGHRMHGDGEPRTMQSQPGTLPPASSGQDERRNNGVQQQGYAKRTRTDPGMSSRHNTHWDNGYRHDRSHEPRPVPAHHAPNPRYESRAAEPYETVNVPDHHGGYLV